MRSIIAKKAFAGYKIDREKADDLKSDILNKKTNLQKKDADKVTAIIRSASSATEYCQVRKTRSSKWKKFKETARDIGGFFVACFRVDFFLDLVVWARCFGEAMI